MFKLFKTILKAGGEVTVKYPFKPLEVSPGFRGRPHYDATQCIACAACTSVCPANALTMETDLASGERRWQLFLGRCIFCGRCEEVCPTRAIALSEEFEMAVSHKADLYTTATFTLQDCRICHQRIPGWTKRQSRKCVRNLKRARLASVCKTCKVTAISSCGIIRGERIDELSRNPAKSACQYPVGSG
jgi:formate hydrogenlyase subunit 6/NADH:ubiquinone oxidoreductase subunit I